jgi:hypothetical protein
VGSILESRVWSPKLGPTMKLGAAFNTEPRPPNEDRVEGPEQGAFEVGDLVLQVHLLLVGTLSVEVHGLLRLGSGPTKNPRRAGASQSCGKCPATGCFGSGLSYVGAALAAVYRSALRM